MPSSKIDLITRGRILRLPGRRRRARRQPAAAAAVVLHSEGGRQLQRRTVLAHERAVGAVPSRRDVPLLVGTLHAARGARTAGGRRAASGDRRSARASCCKPGRARRSSARATGNCTSSDSTAGKRRRPSTVRWNGFATRESRSPCPAVLPCMRMASNSASTSRSIQRRWSEADAVRSRAVELQVELDVWLVSLLGEGARPRGARSRRRAERRRSRPTASGCFCRSRDCGRSIRFRCRSM